MISYVSYLTCLYVAVFFMVNIHRYLGKVGQTARTRILREEKGPQPLVPPGYQEAIPSKLNK